CRCGPAAAARIRPSGTDRAVGRRGRLRRWVSRTALPLPPRPLRAGPARRPAARLRPARADTHAALVRSRAHTLRRAVPRIGAVAELHAELTAAVAARERRTRCVRARGSLASLAL